MPDLKTIVAERGAHYPWAAQLNFPEPPNHQTMPTPYVEIGEAAWWEHGMLGHECLGTELFTSLFLDGANTLYGYPPEHPRYDPKYVGGALWSCIWRFYPSAAYVVAYQYVYDFSPLPLRMPEDAPYSFKVSTFARPGERTGYITRYFRVGCIHEHRTGRQLGSCLRESTCQDCGYTYTIDSSD